MAQDILIDDSGDFQIVNGDFKIGNSDMQHAVLLIETYLGSWKQSPTKGVGIQLYSGSSGLDRALQRNITEQMKGDEFTDVSVLVNSNPDGTYDYNISASRIDGI